MMMFEPMATGSCRGAPARIRTSAASFWLAASLSSSSISLDRDVSDFTASDSSRQHVQFNCSVRVSGSGIVLLVPSLP